MYNLLQLQVIILYASWVATWKHKLKSQYSLPGHFIKNITVGYCSLHKVISFWLLARISIWTYIWLKRVNFESKNTFMQVYRLHCVPKFDVWRNFYLVKIIKTHMHNINGYTYILFLAKVVLVHTLYYISFVEEFLEGMSSQFWLKNCFPTFHYKFVTKLSD